MATIPIPVMSYMATEGLEDVDDGDLIDWKIGDSAILLPKLTTQIAVMVTIASRRGAHNEARYPDGRHKPVYEITYTNGEKYCVDAERLRHINFKHKYLP